MMTDETTTEQLAEIEGQATEYTPPDGWRVVRFGEQLQPGDMWVNQDGTEQRSAILHWDAAAVSGGRCIRPIEPQPEPQAADYTPPEGWRVLRAGEVLQPGDAWAHPQADLFEENLNLTGVAGSHGYYLRRQVCEGRWRTRGGKEISVTAMPTNHTMYLPGYPWWDGDVETWKNDGGYYKNGEALEDLVKYLGPNLPEPDRIITPDDVAAEALRRQLETTEAALLEQQQRNEQLVTQGSQQRMQIAELQRELSESVRLVVQQQNRIQDLLTMDEATEPEPEPQPVHMQAMMEAQAETIARLNSEIHDLNCEIGGLQCKRTLDAELQAQLEAVKAELVRQCENSRLLQIELDAREQVPQAVSDRFEEGWDKGTAQAVETIAEWLEPLRKGNTTLRAAVLFHLPHIMRSLTGLTDED